MARTLYEPDSDQQVIDTYNRGMVAAERLPLATDSLYALCLLKLNNGVEPTDYPALKTAIEAITGVQQISLVIDHRTRPTIPTGRELSAIVEINLRLDPIPEPE